MVSGAEPPPKTVLVQFDLQRSPLMTANASPALKSGGYCTPSPKSGGTGTPRSLCLCILSRHAALGLLGRRQRYAIYIFHSQCHN